MQRHFSFIHFLLIPVLLPTNARAQGQSVQSLPTIVIQSPEKIEKPKLIEESNYAKVEMNGPLSSITSQYDALNLIPGVQTREQGQTAPAISIRGSVKADRVLSIYNGIPMNTADGLGARRLLVPKEILLPIRIYKGSVSARFGGSAMGGAAVFRNRFATQGSIGVHGAGTATSGSTNGGATVIVPLQSSKKHKLQFSAYGNKDTGEFEFQNARTGITEIRQNNDQITQRFTFHGQHRIGTWKLKESLIIANEYGTTPGSILAPSATTFNTLAGLGAIQIGKKLAKTWTLETRTSFFLIDSEFISLDKKFPDTTLQNQKFYQSVRSNHQIGKTWKTSVVFDYAFSSLSSLVGASGDLQETKLEWASLNQLKLSQSWQVEANARYLADYEKIVPEIELAHVGFSHKLWLKYGEGFRTPSPSEKFANLPTFVGNPNVTPESSRQIELGYLQSAKRRYEFNLTSFALFYEDFLTTTAIDETKITPINQGSARVLGLESSYKLYLGNWSLGIAAAFMNTYNEKEDDSIRLTPDIETTASLSYQLGNWAIGVLHNFWGESLDKNTKGQTVVLDLGHRTDLKLEAKFKNWSLAAALDNAFDIPRESKFGFPDPQRQVKLSMRYLF